MNSQLSTSTIEISRSALLKNVTFFKNLNGASEVYPVVKANAYGHGLNLVAAALEECADGFCVHSLVEAMALKTGKPILILGHFPDQPGVLAECITEKSLIFTVVSRTALKVLDQAGKLAKKQVQVFLKLETGTHRLGVTEKEAVEMVGDMDSLVNVSLSGYSMHFANIEDTTDHTYAEKQMDTFNTMIRTLSGDSPVKRMSACSAAALLFEQTRHDIVRLGISCYGYFSSRETFVSYKNRSSFKEGALKPALTWKTRPLQIKKVPAGEYVGYGLTYKANRDMTIAVLPVGYSDGYDRRLSNSGYVLIDGHRAPVCGRVCMNLIMVDVTYINTASPDSEVILLGKSGGEIVSADTMASLTGSINYQVLAALNPFIYRTLTD